MSIEMYYTGPSRTLCIYYMKLRMRFADHNSNINLDNK